MIMILGVDVNTHHTLTFRNKYRSEVINPDIENNRNGDLKNLYSKGRNLRKNLKTDNCLTLG